MISDGISDKREEAPAVEFSLPNMEICSIFIPCMFIFRFALKNVRIVIFFSPYKEKRRC